MHGETLVILAGRFRQKTTDAHAVASKPSSGEIGSRENIARLSLREDGRNPEENRNVLQADAVWLDEVGGKRGLPLPATSWRFDIESSRCETGSVVCPGIRTTCQALSGGMKRALRRLRALAMDPRIFSFIPMTSFPLASYYCTAVDSAHSRTQTAFHKCPSRGHHKLGSRFLLLP